MRRGPGWSPGPRSGLSRARSERNVVVEVLVAPPPPPHPPGARRRRSSARPEPRRRRREPPPPPAAAAAAEHLHARCRRFRWCSARCPPCPATCACAGGPRCRPASPCAGTRRRSPPSRPNNATRCHSVRSCCSPDCLSRQLSLVAMRRLATVVPRGHRAGFGIRAQIADEDDLVDAARHGERPSGVSLVLRRSHPGWASAERVRIF